MLPAAKHITVDITQLIMITETLLVFMNLIFLPRPDPMIPDETVSVIAKGTPNWLANSTAPAPTSWLKQAFGYLSVNIPSVNRRRVPRPRVKAHNTLPNPTTSDSSPDRRFGTAAIKPTAV